jgi:hypothetical protein
VSLAEAERLDCDAMAASVDRSQAYARKRCFAPPADGPLRTVVQ